MKIKLNNNFYFDLHLFSTREEMRQKSGYQNCEALTSWQFIFKGDKLQTKLADVYFHYENRKDFKGKDYNGCDDDIIRHEATHLAIGLFKAMKCKKSCNLYQKSFLLAKKQEEEFIAKIENIADNIKKRVGFIKSKLYVLELLKENKEQPIFDYYYCWDSTKYGIDNDNCEGIEIVPAGYSPHNLKDLIFLPVI